MTEIYTSFSVSTAYLSANSLSVGCNAEIQITFSNRNLGLIDQLESLKSAIFDDLDHQHCGYHPKIKNTIGPWQILKIVEFHFDSNKHLKKFLKKICINLGNGISLEYKKCEI